jgi:hypothetical protein
MNFRWVSKRGLAGLRGFATDFKFLDTIMVDEIEKILAQLAVEDSRQVFGRNL